MIMMADKKRMVTSILGPNPSEEKEGPSDGALTSVVEELIQAIHGKDVESATAALRAIFAELDAEPHEEGEHTGE